VRARQSFDHSVLERFEILGVSVSGGRPKVRDGASLEQSLRASIFCEADCTAAVEECDHPLGRLPVHSISEYILFIFV
jgi:hypothetical protein